MGDKRHGHQGLFELATRQHGVVSTRQLKALGYGRNAASKAHRVGRLRRIHRGVYAVGHEVLDWRGWCMSAVLAAHPAVASHLSAGYLWGLLRRRPTAIEVTTPTCRRQRRGFRAHCAVLGSADLAVVDGVPSTTVARTLLDLAPILRPSSLDAGLERAEELRLFDLAAVEELLSRAARHPGSGRLRQAIATYRDGGAFTRSALERRFLKPARSAGLPTPSMNYNVAGFELDAYWDEQRFAVELDVFETHGTRAAFERDRLRQEELKLMGIEMIRITGLRLDREPDQVMGRLRVLLARRSLTTAACDAR